jgi:hypothetical protein
MGPPVGGAKAPSALAVHMTDQELAELLKGLGCPPEKCLEMARQLDKRARQLAAERQQSHAETLAGLLSLMSQGWAARKGGAEASNL